MNMVCGITVLYSHTYCQNVAMKIPVDGLADDKNYVWNIMDIFDIFGLYIKVKSKISSLIVAYHVP